MGDFSATDVRNSVAKICNSAGFANSSRMQRFLRFAVDQALENRAQELKEYVIGVQVFDRLDTFDPRIDPIVRVEARRLRRKLSDYYQTEGRTDQLRIDFEKGAYVPHFRFHSETGASRDNHTQNGNPSVDPHSMAILPFRNIGPDSERDYFSDGLTEELIHLLTRVPALRVVAWTSSAQMKDEQDFSRVRSHLNVGAMLRGTVRRSGDQLRITVQLIDTANGSYVWSEIYNRQMRDLFEIESEIAQAIVSALKVRSGLTAQPPASERATNPESHRLYLLGRFHLNRRTPEGLAKSIECYRGAIAQDPTNAAAHGGMALTYILLHQHFAMPQEEAINLATEAAQRALQLDPDLAEGYTALAYIRGNAEWRWEEAERLYRRAIQHNPGYATAHHWYATDHLVLRGRVEEAMREADLARDLDPLSPIITESRGLVAVYARQYEEALDHYREVEELDPFFFRVLSARARVYSLLGRYTEAIDCFIEARQRCGDLPHILTALGQTYGLAGMPGKARLLLQELDELAVHQHVSQSRRALVHIGLGETDTALDLIEAAVNGRDFKVVAALHHPAYDALRGMPRFEALLRRLNTE